MKYAIQKVWGEHMLLLLLLSTITLMLMSLYERFSCQFSEIKKSDTLNEKFFFVYLFKMIIDREWSSTSIFAYSTRLDYFFVYSTRLDSTISIIACYSMLKILIFSTIYSHIRLALDHFWAYSTRPDSTIWYSQWLVLD